MQVFDSWAHHLTPQQFQEFSLPYAERLIQRVRAVHPQVPLIFHANGGTGKLGVIQAGCSADVVGIDWGSDIAEARKIFGPSAVLQVHPRNTQLCKQMHSNTCTMPPGTHQQHKHCTNRYMQHVHTSGMPSWIEALLEAMSR